MIHAQAQTDARCAGSRDLRLTNGRIMTMDRQNSVVSEVVIQNGKFTAVGRNGDTRTSPCTRTINLRGRTVTPGHCGDAATSMAPSKPTSDGMPTPTRRHGNDLKLP